MSKEELFNLIIESKELIDQVVWIVKIEERVDKTYLQYLDAIKERWHKDKKFIAKVDSLLVVY